MYSVGLHTASDWAIATPAHATLLARDLNGDTVIDAFYDTDRDITWLRNANVNGVMNWAAANTWANGFSIGIYDDWRLSPHDFCVFGAHGVLLEQFCCEVIWILLSQFAGTSFNVISLCNLCQAHIDQCRH